MRLSFSKTTVRVLLTLAVAVMSSGCAMKGDIRQLQDEMRTMAARQDSLVMELRNQTMQTQDSLRTQGDQMFDFRGDISRRLQQIEQSLVRLEAIAGENQRGMAGIRDQLANLRRPTTPFGGGAVTPDSTAPGGESLIGGAGSANELYRVAMDQLNRGSFNAATQAFEQFLSEHPNDPKVPDAHYFLADILVQQDRPEEALVEFQEIPQLFPTAPKVPDTLFRIADLQQQLGDVDAARATLERIVNTYPDQLVAQLARERLREIGKL